MRYYKVKIKEGSGVSNRDVAKHLGERLSVPTFQKNDFSPVWIPIACSKSKLDEVLSEINCFFSVKEKEKEDEFFPESFLRDARNQEFYEYDTEDWMDYEHEEEY